MPSQKGPYFRVMTNLLAHYTLTLHHSYTVTLVWLGHYKIFLYEALWPKGALTYTSKSQMDTV